MAKKGNSKDSVSLPLEERLDLSEKLGDYLKQLRKATKVFENPIDVVEYLYDEYGGWDVEPKTARTYINRYERGGITQLIKTSNPELHSQILSDLLALYGLNEKNAREFFDDVQKLAPSLEYKPSKVRPPKPP